MTCKGTLVHAVKALNSEQTGSGRCRHADVTMHATSCFASVSLPHAVTRHWFSSVRLEKLFRKVGLDFILPRHTLVRRNVWLRQSRRHVLHRYHRPSFQLRSCPVAAYPVTTLSAFLSPNPDKPSPVPNQPSQTTFCRSNHCE